MSARRTAIQVACPSCGHHFALEGSIAESLENQWRDRERAAVRREIAPEVDKKAEVKAEQLAKSKLREKDEELRDREKTISSLKSQLTRMQKKMPVARAQELGVMRQHTLAEMLSLRFPTDRITVIPRGVAGADVVQVIVQGSGQPCGSILWESKRAQAWAKSWVVKLRTDQKRGGHTVGVIVSDVLSDDDKALLQVDGVWTCKVDAASDLACLLRESVVQAAIARGASARRDDLKGRVYDYMTGPDFAAHVASLVTAAMAIRNEVDSERRAFQAKWAERERLAEAMVEDLAGVYGDLRGIGASLPKVQSLELEPIPLVLAAGSSPLG